MPADSGTAPPGLEPATPEKPEGVGAAPDRRVGGLARLRDSAEGGTHRPLWVGSLGHAWGVLFMALGGLGVSLAGFAGLIATLDRRAGARGPVAVWRIRHIVIGGFIVTSAGFGTVALYTATGKNLELTIRLVSLVLAAAFAIHVSISARPGPAWAGRAAATPWQQAEHW